MAGCSVLEFNDLILAALHIINPFCFYLENLSDYICAQAVIYIHSTIVLISPSVAVYVRMCKCVDSCPPLFCYILSSSLFVLLLCSPHSAVTLCPAANQPWHLEPNGCKCCRQRPHEIIDPSEKPQTECCSPLVAFSGSINLTSTLAT